ncbi:hypothetical protein [Streptomyces sp. I6]|nr:hypothetical protein [Streptomyces sp. I6]
MIAQIQLEGEWQRELDEMKDAFVDLLMKYFAKLPRDPWSATPSSS